MNIMRHVGKIANTDERCVVAFMQIPQRTDHALVIPTDTLPPRFEQAVMDVLRSPEGQNEECLAVALSRRLMPDTGKDILATLHERGMLRAVPCSRILMLPLPNQPFKLTDVLEKMGKHTRSDDDSMMHDQLEKFNRHTNNIQAGNTEQQRGIARNLMIEADLHIADAQRKREQAYAYDPSLRPRPDDTHVEPMGELPVATPEYDPAQMTLDSLLRD